MVVEDSGVVFVSVPECCIRAVRAAEAASCWSFVGAAVAGVWFGCCEAMAMLGG